MFALARMGRPPWQPSTRSKQIRLTREVLRRRTYTFVPLLTTYGTLYQDRRARSLLQMSTDSFINNTPLTACLQLNRRGTRATRASLESLSQRRDRCRNRKVDRLMVLDLLTRKSGIICRTTSPSPNRRCGKTTIRSRAFRKHTLTKLVPTRTTLASIMSPTTGTQKLNIPTKST